MKVISRRARPAGGRTAAPELRPLLVALLLASASCVEAPREPLEWAGSPGVVTGGLVVALPSGPGTAAYPSQPELRTSWTNGRSYRGMEDNDLRGYLDGRFKYGWNQAGQVHVRVGRRGRAPRWGEWELFRILHEWRDVELPPGAEVVDASLRLAVEGAGPRPVRLLLYAVRRGFGPGLGGVAGDNVSPPDTGEVWWNDAAFELESWALPGAGFASDDPTGDTGARPLAFTSWAPGDSVVVFRSDELADYLQSRVDAGEPLRFLIRLSALDEDTPGTVLEIYSGSTGDDWEVGRRPRLSATWRPPASSRVRRWPVFLDYGRSFVTERIPVGEGGVVGAHFEAGEESLAPALEIRGGIADSTASWIPAHLPMEVRWEWVQIRVNGASHPVRLGGLFRAELRDTWIRTAAPEDQRIPFVFTSPSGRVDTVVAEYAGDYRWRVEFLPDELGPWRYSWTTSFTEAGYEGPEGNIDVIPGEVEGLLDALRALGRRAEREEWSGDDLTRAMVQFMRLERGVVEGLGPVAFRSREGLAARALLDSVRAVLGGAPVPDSLPLVRDVPAPWTRGTRADSIG